MFVATWLATSGLANASPTDPCEPPTNPVTCENSKPGTPASVWDINGAGDPSIQGFATDISVDNGASISFKVDTSAPYTMTIYRLGYYGGDGARQITTLTPTPRTQPECLSDPATGLVDCGNWLVSAAWNVPADAVSGVYIILLRRTDTGGESHITFIVRDDSSHSDLIFQTADSTWQAYNLYGGSSFYAGIPAGRAYKVSYNRPFSTRGTASGRDFLFANEYPMIRFLESNGYDVSYTTNVDSDRRGNLLTNHKTFLSVGHDEYWSGTQRANVEAARDAGVNLAFFSGNEVYWKTRWETSVDGSGTSYRTLVCYKETRADAKIDPSSEWTGTWRDPRFTPPSNGNIPENALTGTAYMSNFTDLAIQVPAAQGKTRFWRNTPVASLGAGQTATLADHTVGYESDEDLDNGFRPAGLIRLSTTTGPTPEYLQDFGSAVEPGTTTHHMTLYRAPSGALVFGAGTIQYSWALDSEHDGIQVAPDPALRQATVNLLADMGAQPLNINSGLVAASKSTDITAPTATITSPAVGAPIANGAQTTISGTASDNGGGIVAGVEVSVDGGQTWHPATGTTSWSYTFYAVGSGMMSLKARATDDSGNIQSSATNRSVTINCPCSLFGNAVPKMPSVNDTSDVELGIRFKPATDGLVTGVRFYKGTSNTGTHTGSLWSESGTKLATGTFTNETASGWQTLTFSSPVSVSADITYVASYRAPQGGYAADPLSFSVRDWSALPLTAVRSVGASRNGVFASGGLFPSSSYKDANYFTDVTFQPASTIAPSILSSAPADGATDSSRTAAIKGTFGVAVTPGTPTMTVTGPGGSAVEGSVSLSENGKEISFTPSSPLAATTGYTVMVSGAVSTYGIPMTDPVTWTFTTVAACPCSIFPASSTPAIADPGDGASIELGLKFVPASNGMVTGVRFYKAPANTGTHTGSLWSATGTLLATGTFTGETASGWQTLTFSSPVAVTAGTTYVASYYAPNGHYSYSGAYFTSDVITGALTAPAAGNGAYRYGGGFPSNSYNSANYWVDITFLDSAIPDTAPPVISALAGTAGASTATVTWTTDKASTSVVAYGTSAGSLSSSASTGGMVTSHSVKLTGLTPGTTYRFRVTSLDAWGNSATWPESASAPAAMTTTTCPCSVFPTSATPAVVDSADGASIELGMRFVPEVNGSVTGIRFYKAPANTGTHTGSLWSATGTLLATGTFTGETASGWQTLTFSSPVAVTAGTTYVASYHAPNGHYSYSGAYFTADMVADPLIAPAAGNGAYRYGGGFPSNSYNSANYWVDVSFTHGGSSDATAPSISDVSASEAASSATVTWTTNEPSTSVVAYGTSAGSLLSSASTAGMVTSHSVTLTGLSPGTTYHYTVSSADVWGNTATSPTSPAAPATITTTGCPCSVFSTSSAPAVADSGDTASVELGMRFVPASSGAVTSVRFYKAAANTGTHTGSLWSAGGTLLETGTFTGETESGWQTLTFSSPVQVTAGTTYVVSYFAPNGHYSYSGAFFTLDVVSDPLTAPADGNGVYRYGGGFPSSSSNNSANYWVDVVFQS
jgi:Domain of unknown function (DUF4082)/Bacterial Ig-like domain/Purple acid Phosphatase, N-terminal domain/Bacterial Ig domain